MVGSLVFLAILCGAVIPTTGTCDFFNITYENFEEFILHDLHGCSKYRCEWGHVSIIFRGCKMGTECLPPKSVRTDVDCNRYNCTRTSPRSQEYKLRHDRTFCQDMNGVCYSKITTRLVRDLNGVVFTNCTCTILSVGHVHYQCDLNSRLDK
ncbi:hypothetical protein BsWGS_03439 [Bradybaena similaris]